MGGTVPLHLRRIKPADYPAVKTFRCAWPSEYRTRASKRVEQLIRGVPDLVERGRLECLLGFSEDGRLLTLAAWHCRDEDPFLFLLATTSSDDGKHRGQGHGSATLAELVDRLRAAGHNSLVAEVDVTNTPMLQMLEQLNADVFLHGGDPKFKIAAMQY